jgi:hypothetical protein
MPGNPAELLLVCCPDPLKLVERVLRFGRAAARTSVFLLGSEPTLIEALEL